MTNEIRRHRILNEALDEWLESPVTLPLEHICSVLEMCCKMVRTIFPGRESDRAEPTSGLDLRSCAFPLFHPGTKSYAMHQPEMLVKVILPVEGPLLDSLLLAGIAIV